MTEASLVVPFSFTLMACQWLLWGQSWQERTDREREGERKGGEGEREIALPGCPLLTAERLCKEVVFEEKAENRLGVCIGAYPTLSEGGHLITCLCEHLTSPLSCVRLLAYYVSLLLPFIFLCGYVFFSPCRLSNSKI